MSDRFKNFVFIITIAGCLAVTALNTWTTKYNQAAVIETFDSQAAQAAQSQQIAIAQKYGLRMANIAELEANHAHRMHEKMDRAEIYFAGMESEIDVLRIQILIATTTWEAQAMYIQQLMEYIEANNLPIPVPDLDQLPPFDPVGPIKPTDRST